MPRFGPLEAVPGGVALADVTALHVRLAPDGVSHRRGDEVLAEFPWERIESFAAVLSRSPLPGMFAVAADVVLQIMGGSSGGDYESQDFAQLGFTSGESFDLPLHVRAGGYSSRSVDRTLHFLEQCVHDAELRARLAEPEAVLAALRAGRP